MRKIELHFAINSAMSPVPHMACNSNKVDLVAESHRMQKHTIHPCDMQLENTKHRRRRGCRVGILCVWILGLVALDSPQVAKTFSRPANCVTLWASKKRAGSLAPLNLQTWHWLYIAAASLNRCRRGKSEFGRADKSDCEGGMAKYFTNFCIKHIH